MNVIIAGSRTCTDMKCLEFTIKNWPIKITKILCGGARGADELGKQWAHNHKIPVSLYPANWSKFGIYAGHLRNIEMTRYADALIALWDGKSPGTDHMIKIAQKKGLEVNIAFLEPTFQNTKIETISKTGLIY